jgi:hypothetical protein
MRALLTLVIYVAPFLAIAIAIHIWMKQKAVGLSDVQAERDGKPQSRFLLGIWRRDDS